MLIEDRDRHVVPRWRSVPNTIAAGEFQTRSTPRPLDSAREHELSRVLSDWVEYPGPETASDFVAVAIVAGEAGRAVAAAEQLRNPGLSASIRHMAETVAGNHSGRTELVNDWDPEALNLERVAQWISRQKQRLAEDPRNALGWVSLARRYVSIGQNEQADRALGIALSLAPRSRYVMRIYARFCVHMLEPEKAIRVIERSGRIETDPLICAAYLSLLGFGELPVRSLRSARVLAEDANFKRIERSDLMSQIATLELSAGSGRKVRQLFERSLHTPTDNSLAQAEWASRRLPSLEVRPADTTIPFAAEARAQHALQEGSWGSVLQQSIQWQLDQPFDTEAALVGSHAALAGLAQWEDGLRIAEIGLRSHPGNRMLTNNVAYALVELGLLAEAQSVLDEVGEPRGSATADIALLATQGLLLFRSGDQDGGRLKYRRAVDAARATRESSFEAVALAMLLREEAQHASDIRELGSLVDELDAASVGVRDPGVDACKRRALEAVRDKFTPHL